MNQWSSVNLFTLSEKARVSSHTYIYFIFIYLLFFRLCRVFTAAQAFYPRAWAGLLSSCGGQGSHCGGFSGGAPALAHAGFGRGGTWA